MDEVIKKLNQEEKNDYRFLVENRNGLRFLARLLDKCGVFKTSFHSDPLKMAFMEGQRNIGLEILSKCLDINEKFLYNIQLELENLKKEIDSKNTKKELEE